MSTFNSFPVLFPSSKLPHLAVLTLPPFFVAASGLLLAKIKFKKIKQKSRYTQQTLPEYLPYVRHSRLLQREGNHKWRGYVVAFFKGVPS